MSIKKNALLTMRIRIKNTEVPFILPLRCLGEIADGFSSITSIIKPFKQEPYVASLLFEQLIEVLRINEPIDIMDIDIDKPDEKFKMKMSVR